LRRALLDAAYATGDVKAPEAEQCRDSGESRKQPSYPNLTNNIDVRQ
jgi:hypothetical protein